MNQKDFYNSHITTLLGFRSKAGEDEVAKSGFDRGIRFWLQQLMAESAIPADFKLEMLKTAKSAGVCVPSWLHP